MPYGRYKRGGLSGFIKVSDLFGEAMGSLKTAKEVPPKHDTGSSRGLSEQTQIQIQIQIQIHRERVRCMYVTRIYIYPQRE